MCRNFVLAENYTLEGPILPTGCRGALATISILASLTRLLLLAHVHVHCCDEKLPSVCVRWHRVCVHVCASAPSYI